MQSCRMNHLSEPAKVGRIGDEEVARISGLHRRTMRHHWHSEMSSAYLELNQAIHLGVVQAAGHHVLIETCECRQPATEIGWPVSSAPTSHERARDLQCRL